MRRRLTTKQRRELYERECQASQAAGLGDYPICNIDFCKRPVKPGELWDESHVGVPAAFGGTCSGVAHRRCNRIHGAKVVTPFVAKTKRVTDKFLDIKRTSNPLPGGRDHHLKKKLNGRVTERFSHG